MLSANRIYELLSCFPKAFASTEIHVQVLNNIARAAPCFWKAGEGGSGLIVPSPGNFIVILSDYRNVQVAFNEKQSNAKMTEHGFLTSTRARGCGVQRECMYDAKQHTRCPYDRGLP